MLEHVLYLRSWLAQLLGYKEFGVRFVEALSKTRLLLVMGGTGCCVVEQRHDEPGRSQSGVVSRVCQDQLGGKGSAGLWVGECWDPSLDEHAPRAAGSNGDEAVGAWRSTVRAVDGTLEAVSFDAELFYAAVRGGDLGGAELHAAAERMQMAALRAQRAQSGEHHLLTEATLRARHEAALRERVIQMYYAMVALAVCVYVEQPW